MNKLSPSITDTLSSYRVDNMGPFAVLLKVHLVTINHYTFIRLSEDGSLIVYALTMLQQSCKTEIISVMNKA